MTADDLAAFLAARYGEDEAVAKAAPGELDTGQWPFWIEYMSTDEPDAHAAAAYRDHFPPSRTLREVEAGRARLAYYEHAQAKLDHIVAHPGEMSSGDAGMWLGKTAASRMACRHDAAVYSDHPDYRQEWKP